MPSRPKGSRQSSQKDHRCNADTPSTKGMSSSGRSASLGGVESQTASAVEQEAEDANSKPSYAEWGFSRYILSCVCCVACNKAWLTGMISYKT
jgi:hypothetical protein